MHIALTHAHPAIQGGVTFSIDVEARAGLSVAAQREGDRPADAPARCQAGQVRIALFDIYIYTYVYIYIYIYI